MKKSVSGVPRRSNPVRVSNVGSGDGITGGRPSVRVSQVQSRLPDRKSSNPSLIPHPKGRSTSTDGRPSTGRNSRTTAVDFSTRKDRRSRSLTQRPSLAATPKYQTPQHLQLPTAHYSGQSYRSRSNERVFPGMGCRFSSLGGGAKKADGRPVNDKAFQADAMRRVYQFFQRQPGNVANLCPEPGSRTIMIRSFVEMTTYLLHQLMPAAVVNLGNYIVEIPLIMKQLAYPGNITNSWLKTANVPHAWPHVVSMLSWLVDLINYADAGQDMDKLFPLEFAGPADPKDVFDFVLHSFDVWNDGDEERCNELDMQFLRHVRSRQGHTAQQMQAAQDEVARLERELGNPEAMAAINRYKALEEKYTKMCLKEKSIVEAINGENLRSTKIKQSVQETQWEIQRSAQKITEAMKERDQLKTTIGSQVLTSDDAKEIKAKCSELQMQLANQDQFKQSILKVLYSLELKVSSAQSKLSKVCLEYNTEILGGSFEAADSLQLDLAYNRRDLLDSWQKIEDALHDLHTSIKEQVKETEGKLKSTTEHASQLEDQVRAMKNEIRRLMEQHRDYKMQISNHKVKVQKDEENLKKQLVDIEAKCVAMLEAKPDIEAIQVQVKEAEERRDRLKKECAWVQERALKYIVDLQKLMVENRNELFRSFNIPIPPGQDVDTLFPREECNLFFSP